LGGEGIIGFGGYVTSHRKSFVTVWLRSSLKTAP